MGCSGVAAQAASGKRADCRAPGEHIHITARFHRNVTSFQCVTLYLLEQQDPENPMSKSSKKQPVLIIGAGVIGGSLARALAVQDHRYEVSLYSQSPEDIAWFNNLKKDDKKLRDAKRELKGLMVCDHLPNALERLRKSEKSVVPIVVLATPHGAYPELIKQIRRYSPAAIITDTASVKEPVVKMVSDRAEAEPFIPGHPIAGNEGSGASWSDPALFNGAKFVMTLTDEQRKNDKTRSAAARVSTMWHDAGCREMICWPANMHERVFAAVSHMQQLASFALRDMEPEIFNPNARELKLFERFVRLSDSPRGTFWRETFRSNREPIEGMNRHLREELQSLATMLKTQQWEALTHYIEDARKPVQNLFEKTDPVAISPHATVDYTLLPVLLGAAISKVISREEAEIEQSGTSIKLHEMGKSGLQTMVRPLVTYQTPTAELLNNHRHALRKRLDQCISQIPRTWQAALDGKAAGMAA